MNALEQQLRVLAPPTETDPGETVLQNIPDLGQGMLLPDTPGNRLDMIPSNPLSSSFIVHANIWNGVCQAESTRVDCVG